MVHPMNLLPQVQGASQKKMEMEASSTKQAVARLRSSGGHLSIVDEAPGDAMAKLGATLSDTMAKPRVMPPYPHGNTHKGDAQGDIDSEQEARRRGDAVMEGEGEGDVVLGVLGCTNRLGGANALGDASQSRGESRTCEHEIDGASELGANRCRPGGYGNDRHKSDGFGDGEHGPNGEVGSLGDDG
ncbi:unnamed protein product [Ilex paraguariensis]|uniref:Uncharacterized protein n=1 Tax=Ilex paraguariensis TaxID=185542 RepID=A0ABC8QS85_9AQUA